MTQIPRAILIPAAFALGACAESGTKVMPPYQLANGQVLQDVVTVAADPTGGAPVVTAASTYDVSHPGRTRMIARDSASAPGTGQILAGSMGRAVATTATAVVLADALDGPGDTNVNASYATSGNTAEGGGDAGDIDAQTVTCPGENPVCNPSN